MSCTVFHVPSVCNVCFSATEEIKGSNQLKRSGAAVVYEAHQALLSKKNPKKNKARFSSQADHLFSRVV